MTESTAPLRVSVAIQMPDPDDSLPKYTGLEVELTDAKNGIYEVAGELALVVAFAAMVIGVDLDCVQELLDLFRTGEPKVVNEREAEENR